MRNPVKAPSARILEQDPPHHPAPKAPVPPAVQPPEHGPLTLEGFRPDERRMVRAYGD